MAERRALTAGSPVFWVLLKFVLLGPVLRLLFRPRATGLRYVPRAGGAILAANHVSFLDPLLLPLVVPHRRVLFLAKLRYVDHPALHWILLGAGVIPVASDDPEAGRAAVAAGVAAVRRGDLIGIFPEGTRSADGLLHRGKTGAARIAAAAGVPVIPVGITGTRGALPRGALLPRPRPVRIAFGPPIELPAPGDVPADPAGSHSATDKIMAAIAALSGQEMTPDIASAA